MVTPTIIYLHEKGNNAMTVKEKIDYMILSLQVARDELEYAEKYLNNAKNKYNNEKRTPNGTLIRESLRNVNRLSSICASEVIFGPYENELYKRKN